MRQNYDVPAKRADFQLTMERGRLYLRLDRNGVAFKVDVTPVYLFAKDVFEHANSLSPRREKKNTKTKS